MLYEGFGCCPLLLALHNSIKSFSVSEPDCAGLLSTSPQSALLLKNVWAWRDGGFDWQMSQQKHIPLRFLAPVTAKSLAWWAQLEASNISSETCDDNTDATPMWWFTVFCFLRTGTYQAYWTGEMVNNRRHKGKQQFLAFEILMRAWEAINSSDLTI